MRGIIKKGTVYCHDIVAGTLERDAKGFVFRYDDGYFNDPSMPAVSATLPKSCQEYRSAVLFPFFYGLLAEGPQKERQCREMRIDERDHFTRLLLTSQFGAIGAVYVTP